MKSRGISFSRKLSGWESRLSVLVGLMCLCVCVCAQDVRTKMAGSLGTLEVEQRLLLFLDELDGVYSKIPRLNQEQLKKADKSLSAIDHKWNVYSQAHQEAIAGNEHLMEIVVSYQENKQMATDSLQYRLHLLESLQTFMEDESFLMGKDKEYQEMLQSSRNYSVVKAQAPLLEKLKVKEQLIYADVTKHYESAKSLSQEFPILQFRMEKVEERYIELTGLSGKIQAAEYKPFMERIKDYLMSFAAVAIILMFFNMIHAKIQAYKQMRKSAEEYKKMMQGGGNDYPSI